MPLRAIGRQFTQMNAYFLEMNSKRWIRRIGDRRNRENHVTKKVNRILLEQRQRIIQAFEDVSEDYLTVAATIGVNRSTARSIVARYLREGRIAERPRGEEEQIMSE